MAVVGGGGRERKKECERTREKGKIETENISETAKVD